MFTTDDLAVRLKQGCSTGGALQSTPRRRIAEAVARKARSRAVVSTTQLARLCQVDVKTIHHWAERDALPHFRTPGRHLRFHADDVVDFLRRYGYTVPESLLETLPVVHLVSADDALRRRWKRGLSRSFDLHAERDPFRALIGLGAAPADAAVVDIDTLPATEPWLQALLAHPALRRTRVIAVSAQDPPLQKARQAGALILLDGSNVTALRRLLEAVLRPG